jgi:hypothetical protein
MASPNSDTTARIVRILVDCGMIASEELEIVRCLILNPDSAPDGLKPKAMCLPAGAPVRSIARLVRQHLPPAPASSAAWPLPAAGPRGDAGKTRCP